MNRTSLAEMRKRVKIIREFVSRAQDEHCEPGTDDRREPARKVEDKNHVEQIKGEEGEAGEGVQEVDLDEFAKLNAAEMMVVLQKGLSQWERRHGGNNSSGIGEKA